MESACRENVLFIAVSGDSQPHFTTLAAFVSEMGDGVASLFAVPVQTINANWIKDKMEAATQKMIAQQKNADTAPTDEALVKRESLRLERLHQEACQLREWLKRHPEDRKGAKGAVRLSNRTDNGSAKMAKSQGRDTRLYRCRSGR